MGLPYQERMVLVHVQQPLQDPCERPQVNKRLVDTAVFHTGRHTNKLLAHGDLVVKAAEGLAKAVGGLGNPQNNANIADLQ